MATSKSHHISTPNYRFLPILETEYSLSDSPSFDFDDSDLFNSPPSNDSHSFRKTLHSSRYSKPSVSTSLRPASLPVNVPDWSKILGHEYRGNRKMDNHHHDDDDDDDVSDDDAGERGGGGGGGGRVPPHEFLARTRMASLSVHEGVGRTLKGRDLSRVRNAIWAKTGFQD